MLKSSLSARLAARFLPLLLLLLLCLLALLLRRQRVQALGFAAVAAPLLDPPEHLLVICALAQVGAVAHLSAGAWRVVSG